MPLNKKLAIKVLKEMDFDFIMLEASIVPMQDEANKIALFKQIRELRESAQKLKDYYLKLLTRG